MIVEAEGIYRHYFCRRWLAKASHDYYLLSKQLSLMLEVWQVLNQVYYSMLN
jgi:hypothetical protein